MSNVSVRLYNEAMMLDKFTCVYCGLHDPELTVDHLIPRSEGGADIIQNLVACCGACNSKKGPRALYEAGMFPAYGRFAYVTAALARKPTPDLSSLRQRVAQMQREGAEISAIGVMLYEAVTVTEMDPQRVAAVREAVRNGVAQGDILTEIWAVKAGGGAAYKAATDEFRAILAWLVQ
jgi:hypothetical protein